MTTLPAWAVVLLGLAGPIVALAALVVGWLRERDHQDHERKMQKAALEDWRQSRLRQERLEAYTKFMRACDRLHEGDRSAEARAAFRQSVAVVGLVSPSTAIRDAVQELSNFLLVREPEDEQRWRGIEHRRKIDASYGKRLRRLLEVAQRDVGIDPAESGSLAADA
jgi:hypothetical protein